jgi:NADH dehydrogenase [ubiquinone] 1 alpha subcomplex assembly factor 6
MGNMHHSSMETFTAHAESTSSTLLYLLLSLLRLNTSSNLPSMSLSEPHAHNPTSDPLDPDNLAHAASHLGVAQSIVILLRAMPFHASKGRMIIPAEITAKHKVRQEDVFRRGGEAEGISDAVYDFACVAHGHLSAAREMFEQNEGKVPNPALPVFMAGVSIALNS